MIASPGPDSLGVGGPGAPASPSSLFPPQEAAGWWCVVAGWGRGGSSQGPAQHPGAPAAVTHISTSPLVRPVPVALTFQPGRALFPVLLRLRRKPVGGGACSPPPLQLRVPSCRLLAGLPPASASPRALGASAPCLPGRPGSLEILCRATSPLGGPVWAGRGPASQAQPEIETKADFLKGGTPPQGCM